MPRVRRGGRPSGSVVYSAAMELPADAARALEAVRRDGRDVRFEIRKACEQERWRLKVCWRAPENGGESQLGLAWSEDRAGLEDLLARLERGTE
jgi:hypothetical protein